MIFSHWISIGWNISIPNEFSNLSLFLNKNSIKKNIYIYHKLCVLLTYFVHVNSFCDRVHIDKKPLYLTSVRSKPAELSLRILTDFHLTFFGTQHPLERPLKSFFSISTVCHRAVWALYIPSRFVCRLYLCRLIERSSIRRSRARARFGRGKEEEVARGWLPSQSLGGGRAGLSRSLRAGGWCRGPWIDPGATLHTTITTTIARTGTPTRCNHRALANYPSQTYTHTYVRIALRAWFCTLR